MFPFSVIPMSGRKSAPQTTYYEGGGYELISFDAEKLNVFAASVNYCEPHWHLAPELICILSGEFSVSIGHTSLIAGAGSMLYINPNEIHSLMACVPDSQLLTVQFSPRLFDESHPAPQINYALLASQNTRTVDKKVRDDVISLVEHLIDSRPSFSRIALIYHLLGTLVEAGETKFYRQAIMLKEKNQQLVKAGFAFINQHFDEALTLRTVADNVGASYHHFSRIFKQVSGYNFKEYLTITRINKAKLLLKDTRIPITDISYSCGFGGHKPLILAFNKYCHMTPTAFRKRYLTPIEKKPITTEFYCLPLNRQVILRLRSF